MAAVFTTTTFDLLAAIARTPTAAFYLERKTDFKTHVELPLQGLMRRSALRLPAMMRERLETERNLFSRFLKNDFGRGVVELLGRLLPARIAAAGACAAGGVDQFPPVGDQLLHR